jgi:hypothetical protein
MEGSTFFVVSDFSVIAYHLVADEFPARWTEVSTRARAFNHGCFAAYGETQF